MNNSEHTHWLSFSWWFGNLLIGSFLLLIAIGTFVVNAKDIVSSKLGVFDYLGMVVLAACIFPVGLDLLSRPFVTKVVIKTNGLEYHTTMFILLADWKNLVNISNVKSTNAGRSLVVIPRDGNLTLRNWAKPFRKILRHNLKDVQILVSQFGTSNGHSLETDMLKNIPPSK